MSVTTPTREPPERTSLPLTRFAPLETRTLTVVVGTNGRPLLALYARNTATVATSTVTAPIRIGLEASFMGRGGSPGAPAGRQSSRYWAGWAAAAARTGSAAGRAA